MSEPIALITRIGREKSLSVEASGLAITLAEIRIGAEKWTTPPTDDAIGLRSRETQRYPISDVQKLTGERLHVTSLIKDDTEFSFWEMGVYAKVPGENDLILFAIAASMDNPIGVKRKGVSILLAFDLTLVGFKAETINVNSEPPRLNLSLAEEFASMANSFLVQSKLIKTMADELASLKEKVARLEART